MGGLPTGTVTFLFSDIAGSTRLWGEHEQEMRAALATHDALLRSAVERCGGHVVKSTGDGTMAAFASAAAALRAAAATQVALSVAADDRSLAVPLRVRIGVHTGTADERDGDYFGPTLNRAARLMGIGHGGQVLVSNPTHELVEGFEFIDLGEHRLRDLSRPERVFQLCGDGLRVDFPPLRSLDVLATNLPVQLTALFGRDEESRLLTRMLSEQRMVTLTGVGGVGKTRLALHIAGETLEQYPDGVWLVELAAVEPARVLEAVAAELRVDVSSTRAIDASVLDAIRTRKLLLVLDNCEHVLRETRRIVEVILREAPGISVLATSREGLRVGGEQLVPIGSLDDDAAAALFIERAQSADASFAVRDGDMPLIERLCNRLDGMPLAIELAAARVRMFSLDELTGRMEQRFRLLTGGRGGVERHQTLRAAIDWSYDLLEPVAQAVLARLSAFAGGSTLDAAEAVVADGEMVERDAVIDVLGDLVDKSLVLVDRERAETRYGMLETIRQYAEHRLGDTPDGDATRSRHARWCATFAREAGRGLYSTDEPAWIERLTAEVDNLQVAAVWAAASDDLDSAIRLGGSFPRQAIERPLLGTALLAEHALGVVGFDAHPLRARVLAEAAFASVARGDFEAGRERLRMSIAAQQAGARFAASAYTALTSFSYAERDGEPLEIARAGLAAAEAAGDVFGTVGLRITLTSITALSGNFDEALREGQRALDEARQLGVPTIEATALFALGEAYVGSDPIHALEILREAFARNEALGNTQETVACLAMLVVLETKYGELSNGLRALRELLNYRDRMPSEFSFNPAPLPFVHIGRPDLAALVINWRRRESELPSVYAQFDAEAVQLAEDRFGEGTFAELVEQAEAVATDEIHRIVLTELDAILAELAADEPNVRGVGPSSV